MPEIALVSACMAAECLLQRRRNLADGGAGARRIDREREQVLVAAAGGAGERGERLLHRLRIALAPKLRKLLDLRLRTAALSTLSSSTGASCSGR